MPEKQTIERAKKAKHKGRSPSTQSGEFVREEMHHIREGKHGARSSKQAIAIGLSKARRAGVDLAPPRKGTSQKRLGAALRALTTRAGEASRSRPAAVRKRGNACSSVRAGALRP